MRCDFFLSRLADGGLLSSARRWLDVGAGDAWFAERLLASTPAGTSVTCWDPNYSDSDLAAIGDRPGLSAVTDEPTGRFDGILLLDVLEHVQDDERFLRSLVEDHLAPSGSVLISVPAHQKLFGEHDTYLGHYRRYSRSQCRKVIDRAGLKVHVEGGLFHTFAIVRAAGVAWQRLLKRKAPQSAGVGAWAHGDLSTSLVCNAIRLETEGSRRLAARSWYLPGLSYWAFCSRPDA